MQGWTFEDGITVSDAELQAAVERADVIVFGCGGSSMRDFESVYNDAGAIIQAKGKYMDCGEGCDLAELKLKACQIQMLKKLKGYGKPIVSLVIAGRAYLLSEVIENSSAVVWCGYSGCEGARAAYDTLFGKKNNFGRLSFSLPKSAGQLPIYYNQKRTAPYIDVDDKPLFAFGYGLSYAQFTYSNFQVITPSLAQIQAGEKIIVCFDVTNTSNVAGKAVPQLYIHKCGGSISHRRKELKGFEKIALAGGESKKVSFALGFEQLKEWSIRKKYEIPCCNLSIMIGDASDNIIWQTEKLIQ